MAATPVETAEAGHLEPGDRMSRAEFHGLYEKSPEGFHAELVGGVVYVPSPLRRLHAVNHTLIGTVCGTYQVRTPGVEVGDNATILLGDEGEPQPDLYLRVLPEHGGQSSTTSDGYVGGAPELVVEIAHSSRAIDLHAKYEDYRRYGVREYVVLTVDDGVLHGFSFPEGSTLAQDEEVLRSAVFPGLWIDAGALRRRDGGRMLTTLEAGLATPAHAEFVRRLAAARRP